MAKAVGEPFMELIELNLGLKGRVGTEARGEHSTGGYQEQRYQSRKDSNGTAPGYTIHVMFFVNGALWVVPEVALRVYSIWGAIGRSL